MGLLNRKAKKPGELATVQLPLTVGIVAAVAAVGLAAAFQVFTSYRPLVLFVAAALGGAASVTSAYYAAEALATTTRQNPEAIQRAKLLAAFQYIQRWNEPAFSETRKQFRTLLAQVRGKPGEELWQLLSADHDKRSVVLDVLNHFEELGLAVKKGILDEDVAKEYFRFIVAEYYSVFQGWIEKLRAHHTYPGAYIEMQSLRDKWG